MSFIENLTAENLKMPQEEFDKKMGFVDGKTDADLLIEEDNFVEDEERVFILRVSYTKMAHSAHVSPEIVLQ